MKKIFYITSFIGTALLVSLIHNHNQSNKISQLVEENDELKNQLRYSNMDRDKLYTRIGKLLTMERKNQ